MESMSTLNLEMNCSYIHPIPEAKGTRDKNNIKCGQVDKALWWDVLSGDTIQEEGAKSSRAHTQLNQNCFHWRPPGLVCRAWIWGKQLATSLNVRSQHLFNLRCISFLLKTVAVTLRRELFSGKHGANVRLLYWLVTGSGFHVIGEQFR